MLLSIDENDPRPIYLQLMNQIKEQVSRGAVGPGDELPSVRDLAGTLNINLHTVRAAYTRLRQEGIIELRLGRRARIARVPAGPPTPRTGQSIATRFREVINDAVLSGLDQTAIRAIVETELAQVPGDRRQGGTL